MPVVQPVLETATNTHTHIYIYIYIYIYIERERERASTLIGLNAGVGSRLCDLKYNAKER